MFKILNRKIILLSASISTALLALPSCKHLGPDSKTGSKSNSIFKERSNTRNRGMLEKVVSLEGGRKMIKHHSVVGDGYHFISTGSSLDIYDKEYNFVLEVPAIRGSAFLKSAVADNEGSSAFILDQTGKVFRVKLDLKSGSYSDLAIFSPDEPGLATSFVSYRSGVLVSYINGQVFYMHGSSHLKKDSYDQGTKLAAKFVQVLNKDFFVVGRNESAEIWKFTQRDSPYKQINISSLLGNSSSSRLSALDSILLADEKCTKAVLLLGLESGAIVRSVQKIKEATPRSCGKIQTDIKADHYHKTKVNSVSFAEDNEHMYSADQSGSVYGGSIFKRKSDRQVVRNISFPRTSDGLAGITRNAQGTAAYLYERTSKDLYFWDRQKHTGSTKVSNKDFNSIVASNEEQKLIAVQESGEVFSYDLSLEVDWNKIGETEKSLGITESSPKSFDYFGGRVLTSNCSYDTTLWNTKKDFEKELTITFEDVLTAEKVKEMFKKEDKELPQTPVTCKTHNRILAGFSKEDPRYLIVYYRLAGGSLGALIDSLTGEVVASGLDSYSQWYNYSKGKYTAAGYPSRILSPDGTATLFRTRTNLNRKIQEIFALKLSEDGLASSRSTVNGKEVYTPRTYNDEKALAATPSEEGRSMHVVFESGSIGYWGSFSRNEEPAKVIGTETALETNAKSITAYQNEIIFVGGSGGISGFYFGKDLVPEDQK